MEHLESGTSDKILLLLIVVVFLLASIGLVRHEFIKVKKPETFQKGPSNQSFTDLSAISVSYPIGKIVAEDIDGDGDKDILLTHEQQIYILENKIP